jgi:DNA-binding NarL/FixJ family response regulator
MTFKVAIVRGAAKEMCPAGWCRTRPRDLVCLGCHQSREDLFRRVPRERPDALALDTAVFNGAKGAELDSVKLLRFVIPGVPILVIAKHAEPATVLKVLASGAQSYLVKPFSPKFLEDAVRQTIRGEAVLSIEAMSALVTALQEPSDGLCDAARLSIAQRQVLAFSAMGYRHKEIGPALRLKDGTVHTHLNRAFKKLGVSNKRAALDTFAGPDLSISLQLPHSYRVTTVGQHNCPKSRSELVRRLSSHRACRDFLFELRWSEGFRCPRCNAQNAWLTKRGLRFCKACQKQISLTAGTIFHGTRVSLPAWFRAIWTMAENPRTVTVSAIKRALRVRSYQTAWSCSQKLRQCLNRVTLEGGIESTRDRGELFEKLLQTAVKTRP